MAAAVACAHSNGMGGSIAAAGMSAPMATAPASAGTANPAGKRSNGGGGKGAEFAIGLGEAVGGSVGSSSADHSFASAEVLCGDFHFAAPGAAPPLLSPVATRCNRVRARVAPT